MTIDIQQIQTIREKLISHSAETITRTDIDPKHESVFGFGLYSIALIEEIIINALQFSITGRMILRCLAEILITFSFLVKKDEEELWMNFREYGINQAILQKTKFESFDTEVSFVKFDTLEHIANEDKASNLTEIELGHWAGKSLRELSLDSDTKNIYDLFYNWTSSYSHGNWGAIRESVYTNCGNPLHRYHQIPTEYAHALPSILPDSIYLCNQIMSQINLVYPGFDQKFSICI